MIRRCLELVLLLAVSLQFPALAGEPDIQFEKLVHDFGEVERGTVVDHNYSFRNIGDRDLTISRVTSCCGVRAYLPEPQVIPPGGEGEVRVTYTVKGAVGRRKSKMIRVHSNDPDQPVTELTITGLLRPPLSPTPKFLDFGEVPRGEEKREELKILPGGSKELDSITVKSSTEWLTTNVIKMIKGGEKGFRVLVSLRADAPPGELNEELEIDAEGTKAFKVPVHATVTGEISGVVFADKSGPDIHFLETSYHFGVANQGDTVSHIYKFGNIGTKELSISKVSACCGVKASLLSPSVVPSGGEGEVEVRFYSRRRQGDQSKKVRVHSNDPDEPVVELTIAGTVQVPFSVVPDKIAFGEVPRGEKRREELRVVPRQKAVEDISVKSRTDWLTTEVREKAAGGKKEFRVSVILSADTPVGSLNERLEIQSDGERSGTVMVPVLAKVTGNISVVPERLIFTRVGEGDVLSHKLTLSSKDGTTFEILRVESDLEFVSAEVVPLEKGRRYEVLVTLKIEDLSKVRKGNLSVYTDDPEQEIIEVRLFFHKAK